MDNARKSTSTVSRKNTDSQNLKESVKDEINTTISNAKAESKNILESQKTGAATQLHTFAHATQEAAKSLGEENEASWIVPYLTQVSDQIENFAQTLETKSVKSLIDDGTTLARNNPTAFILGSLALGIGLARFFRTSAEHENSHFPQTGRNQNTANLAYRKSEASHQPEDRDFSNLTGQMAGNSQVSSNRSTQFDSDSSSSDSDFSRYDAERAGSSTRQESDFEIPGIQPTNRPTNR